MFEEHNGNTGNNSRQGNGSGYNGGGYQGGQKKPWQKFGNKGGFKKKDEGPGELYKPFGVIILQDCPEDIKSKLASFIDGLNNNGFTVRTDGTSGVADDFEKRMMKKEIIIPWRGFNEKESKFYYNEDRHKDVARIFSPGFDEMKPAVQGFMCRNIRLILGSNLKSPVMFMVVWSADGAETAVEMTRASNNIRQPCLIARSMHIPFINLGKQGAFERLKSYIETAPAAQTQQPNQNYQQKQSSTNSFDDF